MFASDHPRPLPPVNWRSRGLCVGNPKPFFEEMPGRRGLGSPEVWAEAKAICKHCPIRKPCLQYALDNHIQHGVWGGLSDRERRKLRIAKHDES